MQVDNLKLLEKLKALQAKADRDASASVAVGYSAKYALYVHENKEMKLAGKPRPSGLGTYWGPAGAGPNYLVGPARELSKVIAEIVRTSYAKGVELLQCLFLGGSRLQRESQKRVPVEYSNLRGSGFTEKE